MPNDAPSASVRATPPPERDDRVDLLTKDVPALIGRLAELRRKDVLTEEEFTRKKAELLSRL